MLDLRLMARDIRLLPFEMCRSILSPAGTNVLQETAASTFTGKEVIKRSLKNIGTFSLNYRVRQKYLMILQNSCEWNRWGGEFILERSASETQSISVAMGRWSVEHRAFAVETYFKNNDSVLTQRIFRRHFNIHRNKRP